MTYIKIDNFFINLNSNDATTNDSTLSSLSFPFHSVVVDSEEIVDVKINIIIAQIPVSFYNINQSNNILNYTVNIISNTMIVTMGNYNESNLIHQLSSQFTSAGYF